MVPLYLDSQVVIMTLGGDIPQYPGEIFGGSKKENLQELVIRIFNLTEQHNFGIHPTWIPREQNERADFNSHLKEYKHYLFIPRRSEHQGQLTLEFLEWYSRTYMNILFPQIGNPFLIDKVYLGYSLDILEYHTVDAQSRENHLPKGHIWSTQLDFSHSNS